MEILLATVAAYVAIGAVYSFSTYMEFKRAYKECPVEDNKLSAKDLVMMCLLWPVGIWVEVTRSL